MGYLHAGFRPPCPILCPKYVWILFPRLTHGWLGFGEGVKKVVLGGQELGLLAEISVSEGLEAEHAAKGGSMEGNGTGGNKEAESKEGRTSGKDSEEKQAYEEVVRQIQGG